MSRINDEMDKQILEEQAVTNRLLTDSFFFNDQKRDMFFTEQLREIVQGVRQMDRRQSTAHPLSFAGAYGLSARHTFR